MLSASSSRHGDSKAAKQRQSSGCWLLAQPGCMAPEQGATAGPHRAARGLLSSKRLSEQLAAEQLRTQPASREYGVDTCSCVWLSLASACPHWNGMCTAGCPASYGKAVLAMQAWQGWASPPGGSRTPAGTPRLAISVPCFPGGALLTRPPEGQATSRHPSRWLDLASQVAAGVGSAGGT